MCAVHELAANAAHVHREAFVSADGLHDGADLRLQRAARVIDITAAEREIHALDAPDGVDRAPLLGPCLRCAAARRHRHCGERRTGGAARTMHDRSSIDIPCIREGAKSAPKFSRWNRSEYGRRWPSLRNRAPT